MTSENRTRLLYLIGGAARSGKSHLALELLRVAGIPFFSLDFLAMGLAHALPSAGFDPDSACVPRAEKLWEVARPLCANILEAETPAYCIEGDTLLPRHAAELSMAFPGRVRACFLGYPRIKPAEKLKHIRNYPSALNDWMRDQPDSDVLALAEEMIPFSAYLEAECERLELSFYDTSSRFREMVAAARHALLGTGNIEVRTRKR